MLSREGSPRMVQRRRVRGPIIYLQTNSAQRKALSFCVIPGPRNVSRNTEKAAGQWVFAGLCSSATIVDSSEFAKVPAGTRLDQRATAGTIRTAKPVAALASMPPRNAALEREPAL